MRYASIDVLRTFAIAVMVLVHFGENLSGHIYPFAGFGAPLFTFLSGLSYRLWVSGQQARGVSEQAISKISVRRGLFVFGVGFAFNVLVWLPEDTFNWDVLTFVGAALLLLNGVRRISPAVAVVMAALAVFISPLLRAQADYGSYWVNRYFDPDLTLPDVLIGFLATGYFPVFPWIAFSLAGFVAGGPLFTSEGRPGPAANTPPLGPTVLAGTALVVVAAVLLRLRTFLPAALAQGMLGGWTMYPPTVEYVLGTLGISLLLLAASHRYIDRNPSALRCERLLGVAKTFSQYSFTIYVLHHVVHLWPLWIYGAATGHEPTYYWMKAMPVSASLPLAGLFLVICYFVLRWLGPDRGYGIEGWMRWLCD